MNKFNVDRSLSYECHECIWEGGIMEAKKIWFTNSDPNLEEGKPKEYLEIRCPECNVVLDECVVMERK